MKNALRRIALSSVLGAIAVSASWMTGMPFASAQEQEQEHHEYSQQQSHPEYSSNRYYQQGNREGYQDYGRHTQRKVHHHKYRNDDDRKAHDYGYQQGWQGQRYSSDHNHDDRR